MKMIGSLYLEADLCGPLDTVDRLTLPSDHVS